MLLAQALASDNGGSEGKDAAPPDWVCCECGTKQVSAAAQAPLAVEVTGHRSCLCRCRSIADIKHHSSAAPVPNFAWHTVAQAALTVDSRGCQDVVNRAGQAWQLGMMLMQAGVSLHVIRPAWRDTGSSQLMPCPRLPSFT